MMKKAFLVLIAVGAIYFLYRYFTKGESGPSQEEMEHMAMMDQMRQQQMMEAQAQQEQAMYQEQMRHQQMEEQQQEQQEQQETQQLPPRPATQ